MIGQQEHKNGATMKRITYVWLATAVVMAAVVTGSAQAQSQPLGDYARTVRKDKEKEQKPTAAKKYDNDNLPVNDKLSIVGQAPPDEAAANATAPAAGDAAKDMPKTDDAASRQKLADDWKGKIATQRNQIELATRELDVAEREYRLRAAAMYGDAGNRLRSEGTWDKEDAQYKQQIAQKQKAVDDAKQKLDAMQEEARKAGVPARARE
jgi:hypothetical protein